LRRSSARSGTVRGASGARQGAKEARESSGVVAHRRGVEAAVQRYRGGTPVRKMELWWFGKLLQGKGVLLDLCMAMGKW
jgi:hypothetical protein